MIIDILLELIKVLKIFYDIVVDRIGISQSDKTKLIVSFAKLQDLVDKFSHQGNPNG